VGRICCLLSAEKFHGRICLYRQVMGLIGAMACVNAAPRIHLPVGAVGLVVERNPLRRCGFDPV